MMFSTILLPLLVGMFLAINMGGSGTAPSFSAAYGANVIKRFAIPGLFGLFVFFGAILAGKKVVLTLGKGLVPSDELTLTITTIVLLSVAISLLIANLLGVPQSTSQSTVFALAGPGIYLHSLNTRLLFGEIIPTWFILPVISFGLTYLLSGWLKRWLDRDKHNTRRLPRYSLTRLLLVASSAYVAFSIGSNNVANATGPLVSMVMNELAGTNGGEAQFRMIMVLATLVIAPCFGIGASIFGYRVIKSTGKEITTLGPREATLISIVTATLLLAASLVKGIPTSLVQLNALAIMAIGIRKDGVAALAANNTVKKFWIVWLVAPLIALGLSLALTYLAAGAGLLD